VITNAAQLPLVPLVADPGDGPSLSTQDLLDAGLAPDPIWTTLWGTAGLAPFLSQAQEALLGCGSSEGATPALSFTQRSYWGTHCDISGFDLFDTEASAFFQSWPGFEGTEGGVWLTDDAQRAQPGTTGFAGGPVCTRYDGASLLVLPGCTENGGLVHPFTGQIFQSEMAALSWNALMVFVTLSLPDDQDGDGVADRPQPGDLFFPYRFDEFDPLDPFRTDGCSYRNPIVCKNVANLLGLGAVEKRSVKAGGNGRFGRRDFQWAGGASAILEYQKRDVVGFAMDFVEDRTKTSWGVELTWFPKVLVADNDAFDALAQVDLYNLVISMDRPTFVSFLNRSRSFFLNFQLFLQYVAGYRSSFPRDGPVNALATFTAVTGYHQDRLVPSFTWVHDLASRSGAVLFGVSYRYTENMSIQVGANAFYGRVRSLEAALVAPGTPAGGAGRGSQRAYVENGLSQVRDRDELFLRLRYTF
jgi:hypothetical protein